MKIFFLVAKQREARCGVYDYAEQICKAFRDIGCNAELLRVNTWSFKNIMEIKKKYQIDRNTVIHLQYPSFDWGKSISPLFLPLIFRHSKVFLTLHEFTNFNIIRKIFVLSSAIFFKKIVVSNDFEKKKFLQYFPFSPTHCHIIPIGNNIENYSVENIEKLSREKIIYVGQIGENRGIDFFIQGIELLRKRNADFDAAIIGSVVNRNSNFFKQVKSKASELKIELLLELDARDVSIALGGSTIAFLTFPDGISAKRGSALACLMHGLFVVTRHSDKTEEWLRQTTFGIKAPEDAADLIAKMIDNKENYSVDSNILNYELERREWGNIAQEHLKLYGASD